MNTLSGFIKVIEETEVINDKFQKRSVIVDTADPVDKYPNPINLELHQEAVTDIDGYNIGDEVKVLYHVNGREWVNPQGVSKYFVTLKIASLEKLGAAEQPPAKPAFEAPPETGTYKGQDGEILDVPF